MTRPEVCVSIEGNTLEEILQEAGVAPLAGADILEVSFDRLYLQRIDPEPVEVEEGERAPPPAEPEFLPIDVSEIDVGAAIEQLKAAIQLPVIFTCRSKDEGGYFPASEDQRLGVLSAAIESGVSWIDLELAIEKKERKKLTKAAADKGTRIIASHHDTSGTPSKDEIIEMVDSNTGNGDIVKLCFRTNDQHDGMEIVQACWELRGSGSAMSLMGLGPSGDWTRLHAPLLAQTLVYATLQSDFHLSKKGLVNVRDLRDAWDLLDYPSPAAS